MTKAKAPATTRKLTLTGRQEAFVVAYAKSGNATQAATEAGLKAPAQAGSRMLTNVKIKAALAIHARRRARAATMDRNEREAWLAAVARGERKGADWSQRVRCVELLGKMNGDFASVAIVTPPGSAPGTVGVMQPDGDGGPIVTVYMPSNGR